MQAFSTMALPARAIGVRVVVETRMVVKRILIDLIKKTSVGVQMFGYGWNWSWRWAWRRSSPGIEVTFIVLYPAQRSFTCKYHKHPVAELGEPFAWKL